MAQTTITINTDPVHLTVPESDGVTLSTSSPTVLRVDDSPITLNIASLTINGGGTGLPDGGTGLPDGGTDGQVLTKQSATDGDADWETPSGGGSISSTATNVITDNSGIFLPGPNAFAGSPSWLFSDPSVDWVNGDYPAEGVYLEYYNDPSQVFMTLFSLTGLTTPIGDYAINYSFGLELQWTATGVPAVSSGVPLVGLGQDSQCIATPSAAWMAGAGIDRSKTAAGAQQVVTIFTPADKAGLAPVVGSEVENYGVVVRVTAIPYLIVQGSSGTLPVGDDIQFQGSLAVLSFPAGDPPPAFGFYP
jgi:hypothetical protein